MENKELEIITIDNKDYAILREANYKDTTYIYLSNVVNDEDVMIRKNDKNDRDLFIPLDNDKEFDLASLLLFKNTKEN